MSYQSFYRSFIHGCCVCFQLSYLKRLPMHSSRSGRSHSVVNNGRQPCFFSFPLMFDSPEIELQPWTSVHVVPNWASDRRRPGRDSRFLYFQTINNEASLLWPFCGFKNFHFLIGVLEDFQTCRPMKSVKSVTLNVNILMFTQAQEF